MADDDSPPSRPRGPRPRFPFRVQWDAEEMRFQEALGLDAGSQTISSRAGHSEVISPIKMHGLKKAGNITLKKGVVKANSTLWDWFRQITATTIQRKLVRVSLLDEAGNPTAVWTLTNAWPTRVTRVDGTFGDDEVAVELVEFVCDRLTLANH